MEYHTEFEKLMPYKLRPIQKEILETNKNADNHAIICLPTGAGKTTFALFYQFVALKKGKKFIFTTPLKALSSEKYDEWRSDSHNIAGVKALMDTGDTLDERLEQEDSFYDDWNVLITTNERLDSIIRKPKLSERILKDVAYIVFDEVHLLGSKGRGGTVEYLFTALKLLFPQIKLVGLSATLPNDVEFADWAEADLASYGEEHRPVPLEDIFEAPHRSGLYAKQKQAAKLAQLQNIIRRLPNEQFLVFTSSRVRTEALAKDIYYQKTGKTYYGRDPKGLVQEGIAFHHAGVSKDDRKLIENGFRNKDIQIIFATPTLAQGVNLPCTNVVMFDLSRWNAWTSQHETIEHYEIGQMRGRAGRPQYDVLGRCFYLGDMLELEHAKASISTPQDMKSQLEELLDEKILSAVVSGLAVTIEGVIELFQSTFGYSQGLLTTEMIATEIQFLMDNYFINEEYGVLKVSGKGALTSKMYLKPRTITQITKNYFKQKPDTYIELANVFLRNGEVLGNIRVNEMDDRIINTVNREYGYPEAVISMYNPSAKKWQEIDKSPEYAKLLGFIFGEDMKLKLYVPQNELDYFRMNISQFIGRVGTIMTNINNFKEKVGKKKVDMLQTLIKIGTLDDRKAELVTIGGIGAKTIQKLHDNRIFTISDFLRKSEPAIKSILGMRPDRIRKVKAEMVSKYPQYKGDYKKPLDF